MDDYEPFTPHARRGTLDGNRRRKQPGAPIIVACVASLGAVVATCGWWTTRAVWGDAHGPVVGLAFDPPLADGVDFELSVVPTSRHAWRPLGVGPAAIELTEFGRCEERPDRLRLIDESAFGSWTWTDWLSDDPIDLFLVARFRPEEGAPWESFVQMYPPASVREQIVRVGRFEIRTPPLYAAAGEFSIDK